MKRQYINGLSNYHGSDFLFQSFLSPKWLLSKRNLPERPFLIKLSAKLLPERPILLKLPPKLAPESLFPRQLLTKILFRLFLVLLFIGSLSTGAQPLTEYQVDSIVVSALDLVPQAGIAVAVVQDGEVLFQKGYGVRSIETGEPVDENTLFSIASNSKAFTAAALAILVDEGKLNWEDRVIDHIPEFRMYDPYITANFTIVDLLTHRSGLGLGAGDLMIFPDGSDFTIDDVLKSFQYQEKVSDFRTKYDYDNLLYIVAGEVVARISGSTWEDFIEERIMAPLGMEHSAASYNRIRDRSNIAAPHSTETGEVIKVSHYSLDLTNPAGGICACVSDLAKWMQVQLNGGKYGPDLEQQLFSGDAQQEMWYPHTVINYSARGDQRYNGHLDAYGLGWVLSDMNGYTVVSHTGGLPGMLSKTAMVPELNAGVVVLTNTLPGGLNYYTVAQNILDGITGVEPMDWTGFAQSRLSSVQGEADSVLNAVWNTTESAKQEAGDLSKYTGTYEDDWFGKVKIWLEDQNGEEHLLIRAQRSPKMNGEMLFYKATTFAIRWDYTDMECSAFATFSLDQEGMPVSIKMEGISPNIDFSFDFHDLDLKRVDDVDL